MCVLVTFPVILASQHHSEEENSVSYPDRDTKCGKNLNTELSHCVLKLHTITPQLAKGMTRVVNAVIDRFEEGSE